MFKLVAAFCILLSTNVILFAQNTDEINKNEFFVGFTRKGFDTTANLNGFEFSYTRNVKRFFGIKGDVSAAFGKREVLGSSGASFKNKEYNANFLVGIQVKDNAVKKKFKPFGHALIGIGRSRQEQTFDCPGCQTMRTINEETAFSGAFGGGLDIKLSNKIDLRVIQFDYNPIFTKTRQDTARFSVGLVFK